MTNYNSKNNFVGWLKLISITGSAQIIIQAISFISGILIVRLLPIDEYAIYTLANTMLGTMALVADGGIASSVMSHGGKVWNDKGKLGVVLATGMKLRKKYLSFSLLIILPITFFLLLKHDASLLMTLMILLTMLPVLLISLSTSLYQIAPKLNQDILQLQKIELSSSILRTTLVSSMLFIYPFAVVAIACTGIAQFLGNRFLKRISNRYSNNEKPDLILENSMDKTVKELIPVNIFNTISGQINIWIISIIGTTQALAQLGALSRVGFIFSIVLTVFSVLLIPRFARTKNEKKIVFSMFLRIQMAFLFFIGTVVLLLVIFKDFILLILGHQYAGLSPELILMIIASSLIVVSGFTNQLLAARAIIVPAKVFISYSISVQIVIFLYIKPHDVSSVILFSLMTSLSFYILRVCYFLFRIKASK